MYYGLVIIYVIFYSCKLVLFLYISLFMYISFIPVY